MTLALPSPARRHVLVALGAVALAPLSILMPKAQAGEFLSSDGVAVAGHDVVAYFTEGKPVKGRQEHRVEYRGSVFLFASEANRVAFAAEPARYAPQYGGYCAFGVAQGYKASIDPRAFSIVDGRLYLNFSTEVRRQWSRDQPGHIRQADAKWPTMQAQTKVLR